MLIDLFGPEMMQACAKSIANAFASVFAPLLPGLITIIVAGLCSSIFFGAIRRLTYKVLLVSGDSPRQAKKRARLAGDLANLFYSLFGINR